MFLLENLTDKIYPSFSFHTDEIVMGGMVLETNIHAVLQSVKDQGKQHTESLQSAATAETASSIQNRLGGEAMKWQYNW